MIGFSRGQSLFLSTQVGPSCCDFSLSVYSIFSTTTSDSVWKYVSVHINILLICMFICMCCVYLCIKSSEIELQLFLMGCSHTHTILTQTNCKDICCKAPSVFHLIRYSSLFSQFSIVKLFGFGDSFFFLGVSLFSLYSSWSQLL